MTRIWKVNNSLQIEEELTKVFIHPEIDSDTIGNEMTFTPPIQVIENQKFSLDRSSLFSNETTQISSQWRSSNISQDSNTTVLSKVVVPVFSHCTDYNIEQANTTLEDEMTDIEFTPSDIDELTTLNYSSTTSVYSLPLEKLDMDFQKKCTQRCVNIRKAAESLAKLRRQHVLDNIPRLGQLIKVPEEGSTTKFRYSYQNSTEYNQLWNYCQSLEEQHISLQQQIKLDKDEVLRTQLFHLIEERRRAETKMKQLKLERSIHLRESQNLMLEDSSPFSSKPTLHGRYALINLLGKGGFCEVWKAYDMKLDRLVGIKLHNQYEYACAEYCKHREFHHQNIVQILDELIVGKDEFDSYYAIVMELAETDLSMKLKKQKKLPEYDAKNIIKQVIHAVEYMNSNVDESKNIVHFDLKPHNILLDSSGIVKVADFGLSKHCCPSFFSDSPSGTFWYMPPECFKKQFRICSQIDVWSIGVIFYQLLFGFRPFGEGMSQKDVNLNKVMDNAKYVSFPSDTHVSASTKQFIQHCLVHEQSQRPTIVQISRMIQEIS